MKCTFLFIFIIISVILIAQQDSGFELRLDGFRVPSVDVSGYSHDDYMHGGYDGFPIRIQNETINGHGIYMTFMRQASSPQNRRQYMAFADMNGNVQTMTSFPSEDQWEGHGTLAIDQETGNPFFTWHINRVSNVYPGIVNLFYDAYNYQDLPGVAFSDTYLVNNNAIDPNLPPYPNPSPYLVEFEFICPVIFLGPSPHPNYQRLYIFMSNGGISWQIASGGFVKSSAQRLAFADVYFDFDEESEYYLSYVFRGWEDDTIWTIKRIDYFEKIHYWTGEKVEAFPSYTISQDGKVAFAGQIWTEAEEFEWEKYDLSQMNAQNPPILLPNYPDDGTWTGEAGEPYDHFVVINDNYGEGDYHVHRINYEKKWDPYLRLDYENPVTGLHPFNYSGENPNYIYENYTNFSMKTNLITYQTISFDTNGKLHIPTSYGVRFTEPVNGQPPLEEDINWLDTWVGAEIIYNIVYDHEQDNTSLNRVYPFPLNDVGEVSLPMDFNDDGIIDESVCRFNEQGNLTIFFIGSLPHYHWYSGHRPYTNQLKMSASNDGLMTMMWIDSYKSYLYNIEGFSGYGDYEFLSELFVILSENDGESWSAPLQLSYLNSNLVGKPAYVYPADKPIRQNSNSATLYFLYTDDITYGLAHINEVGDFGAYVRLAAIDVSWGVSIQDPDLPFIKPSILSQNYPNPFNPTTNIDFEISKSGKVNLSVYNVKGQLVKTIIDDMFTAGNHSISWHGDDNHNRSVGNGVYFYKLEVEGKQETKKMVLMK